MEDEEKNVKEKFEIMEFFDNARWNGNNYYELNYCKDFINNTMSSEEKLNRLVLLHWITYIAERGSDFRPIWDKGAYVYSNYLKEYFNGTKVDEIFKPNGDFLKETEDNQESTKYKWHAKIKKEDKAYNRIEKYLSKNEKVDEEIDLYYISRYNIADYSCAFITLKLLEEKYEKSILEYIKTFANKANEEYDGLNKKDLEASNIKIARDKEEFIVKGIALALYFLTYDELEGFNKKEKKFKYKGISKKENISILSDRIVKSHEEGVNLLFDDFTNIYMDFYGNKKHQFFNMKRVWCALRDYLKFNYFNNKEVNFIDYIFENIDIDKEKLFKYLELPGDVWNNNSIFSKCLFNQIFDKNREEYNKVNGKRIENDEYVLNRLLRYLVDNKKELNKFSPEQFDCTFDFVPRMCDSPNGNCSFCPFAKFNEKFDKKEFLKLCSCEKNMYCSITMICCGYKTKCKGEECELRNIIVSD